MSEQNTHTFPAGAIKEFLTPVLPQHEAYILTQLGQSRTIYDILFSEQAEIVPPEVPRGLLALVGLILIGPPIEQSFELKPGSQQIFRAPDRAVVSGDNIIPAGQQIQIPTFTATELLVVTLRVLINNANHNRVLLLEQQIQIPIGEYLGGIIDLVNATVATDIGPGLDYVPATGEVNASSNGTYSISVLATVS